MAQFTITVGDRRKPTERRMASTREEASVTFAEVLPAYPRDQITLSENGNVLTWVAPARQAEIAEGPACAGPSLPQRGVFPTTETGGR